MHASFEACARAMKVKFPADMPDCTACKLNQSKRKPFPAQNIRTTCAGQKTHTDTWGPFMSALYYKGCRYVIGFTDDFSRVKFAVFAVDRTTATLKEAFLLYVAFMRTLGVTVFTEWMSDGGPEYVSHDAFDFCDEHALHRLVSVRYSPQQNGVAESLFCMNNY